MPSTRPKLVLDEQSFQGLLAAAFTIQQHNDRLEAAGSIFTAPENQLRPKPPEVCRNCGVPLAAGQIPCPRCGVDSLRSGEHLQHLWASMWQVSQERGLGTQSRKKTAPDASPAAPIVAGNGHDPAGSHAATVRPSVKSDPAEAQPRGEAITQRADELVTPHPSFHNSPHQGLGLTLSPADTPNSATGHKGSELSISATSMSGGGHPPGDDPPDDNLEDKNLADNNRAAAEKIPGPLRGLLDWWERLGSHRADLYLGMAVLVAAVALVWPTTTSQGSSLPAWERILIAIGIAEAPEPVVHYQGDPNVKVWVDTHTALYYCPGEELYGKSPDGHFSTQREAQTDRFEPAERTVCVQ